MLRFASMPDIVPLWESQAAGSRVSTAGRRVAVPITTVACAASVACVMPTACSPQIRRVLEINELRTVTREVVETARETLVIGA
jgi:hypothetical protein